MDFKIPPNTVFVQPKASSLSAAQLTQEHKNSEDLQQIDAHLVQKNEGMEDLETLYSQLHLSISKPRIERSTGRSKAIWNSKESLVQVTHKEGKFETFGICIGNNFYLKYYEALYLLEQNRLQLDHNGVTLSVEQAYLLLLGEASSPKYNEYLVYSCLTRAGYILTKHKNKVYRYNYTKAPKEIDCIWAWLLNSVQRRPVPNHIKKTELYAKVKRQIETIKLSIITPQESVEQSNSDELLPNENFATEPKRLKLNIENTTQDWPEQEEEKSKLDFLKNEPEFKQFEILFQKFDIIKLKSAKSYNNTDSDDEDNKFSGRRLKINFDLYLHNKGFKKSSPLPPVMRVLILNSNQPFPSHAEISKCCQFLLHSTPILIVSVGDAKQVQAFLYIFT